jgi:hypothetical protein
MMTGEYAYATLGSGSMNMGFFAVSMQKKGISISLL